MSADSQFKRLQGYVGTPYVPGVRDCFDLAVQVQREVFARVLPVPPNRPRPGGAAGQRREILAMRDELATPVVEPFTGCAALLVERDKDGEVWHIGTVGVRHGEVWVLHNSAKLGSAWFHPLNELRGWGMRLAGYYAWK